MPNPLDIDVDDLTKREMHRLTSYKRKLESVVRLITDPAAKQQLIKETVQQVIDDLQQDIEICQEYLE